MPQFCAVSECGSRSERDSVGFFRFPSVFNTRGKRHPLKEQRRQKWILATKREDLTESILKNERICSKHFITGKPAELTDVDNPDWVPNLAMGYSNASTSFERSQKALQRSARLTNRSSNAAAAVALHTGEKSFSCTICGFKYSTKSSLTRHMKSHDDKTITVKEFLPNAVESNEVSKEDNKFEFVRTLKLELEQDQSDLQINSQQEIMIKQEEVDIKEEPL